MDFLQWLKNEHAHVNGVMEKLAETGDGAQKTRERLLEQLRADLHVHHRVEEKFLYPLGQKKGETKDLARHCLDETKKTEQVLGRLAKLDVTEAEFMEKLQELQSMIQDHVEEEEEELVPALMEDLDEEQQKQLVEEVKQAKQKEMQAAKG